MLHYGATKQSRSLSSFFLNSSASASHCSL